MTTPLQSTSASASASSASDAADTEVLEYVLKLSLEDYAANTNAQTNNVGGEEAAVSLSQWRGMSNAERLGLSVAHAESAGVGLGQEDFQALSYDEQMRLAIQASKEEEEQGKKKKDNRWVDSLQPSFVGFHL